MKHIITCLLFTPVFFANAQYSNILIDAVFGPNEPSICINPLNPQNIVAGANLNNVYLSNDGGFSWVKDQLTSSYGVWGDPCIITDTAGNFYYLHLSNPPNGSWIDRIVCQRSSDGGNTWTTDSYMGLNGTRAQDKEWAIFDALSKNIYSTWTQFDDYGSSNPNDSSHIMFSKSSDLGLNWSPALRINRTGGDCIDSDNTTEGAVPAVGPDGEIYVAWSNRDTLFFDRSTDGGDTWLNEDLVASTQPTGWDYSVPGIYRANGLPVTKCDLSGGINHGTIYINWSDQRNGGANTDVFIIKSTDGGNTWSSPVRVNDDTTETHQFFTWMDIDQTDGTLYFIFYDRRNYSTIQTDVYIAYSTDGAETFTNVKLSEHPFIPNPGVFFGDYTNISAYGGKVAPIWARMDAGQTSIWTAIVDFPTIAETPSMPRHFMLHQNAPNPFTDNTTIEMNLVEAGNYSLTLFDMMGRKVADVFSNRFFDPGSHQITLDAQKLMHTGSAYYYSLRKGNEVMTKQLIFLNRD